jgi:arabinofuranan 3-O-arabinosyltransferase
LSLTVDTPAPEADTEPVEAVSTETAEPTETAESSEDVSPQTAVSDPDDGDSGQNGDDGSNSGGSGRIRTWVSPASSWVFHVVLAGLAFIPQLLSQPGVVDSDTKSYLYLDPGPFLRQSASMWDPTVGLGTVTHEQIGYLWPMGPFFWVVHALGIPLWVGERLWVGAVLFAAGAGVLALCRTMGVHGRWRRRRSCSRPTSCSTLGGSRSSCCPTRRCPG